MKLSSYDIDSDVEVHEVHLGFICKDCALPESVNSEDRRMSSKELLIVHLLLHTAEEQLVPRSLWAALDVLP